MHLQRLTGFVRRACDDYDMIQEGDHIAVGISGGKDSLSLLISLATMRAYYPKRYTLSAVAVSLGLPDFDLSPVASLCERLEIPLSVVETEIGRIVFDWRKEKNPCSLCANLRRGALNNEAVRLGANRVALGHNKDDVIHTFFLSLFYEGRISTFSPVTYLDRKELNVIRPLIYVPERDIRSFVKKNGVEVVKSPCPANGKTKREDMRHFLTEQSKQFNNMDEKVFSAIRRYIWQDTLPKLK